MSQRLPTQTRTASGAVVGRPRKEAPTYPVPKFRVDPPENIFQYILKRAEDGASKVLIAHELGTSDKTLLAWMEQDPNLEFAFKAGRAKLEEWVIKRLKDGGEENERLNLNAIALANRLLGWRREDTQDINVNVRFIELPATKRPLSDYIDGEVVE